MTTGAVAGPVPRLAARREFNAALARGVAGEAPFAAGKLGYTELASLEYRRLRDRPRGRRALAAFEVALGHQVLRHAGIFPTGPSFLRRWADRFAASVAALDFVGVRPDAVRRTFRLLDTNAIGGTPMRFEDQEPDRSVPADERRCYLPLLSGARVLLVCPFAGFLAARADRQTFEAVRRNTGKPWFSPASVDALELPYGFARETRARYGTVLELFDEVAAAMAERTFDLALIGAGGLGIPLASHAKALGRAGLSLGGHLQVVFGVRGERWRRDREWRDTYFNDAWVDLPARYVPDLSETGEDYW